MRLPVDWINEYVPNNLSVRELAEILTNVGLEVEAIETARGAAVLEIKVTPNRGDCLCVLGVARELATALRTDLKERVPVVAESGPAAAGLASIVLEDPRLCPRYSARVVTGVHVRPSPAWAQRRLELCGLRPINNVVDATNLVMMELGQPLHAFDCRLVRAAEGETAPRIIVRRARAGERIVTIDGEERALTPEVLVIADPGGPIALAGIMGGATTEINDETSEVLLESAHFDPRTVRRGARALQMSTEASYRFERIVDPGGTVRALDRACELIGEFSDGAATVAEGVIDAYPRPFREAQVALRPARANALLGLDLSAAEISAHLRRLGLGVTGARKLRVRVPTFRQDLKEEVDLVEEVARVHGYDHIPETLPGSPHGHDAVVEPGGRRATRGPVGRLSDELVFERAVRATMRGLGLSETVTPSLESPQALPRLGVPGDHPLARAVVINNAKTVDRSQLRTTLFTSMLDVLAHNRRHGVSDVSIFDLGRVYWSRGADELPDQPQHLGLACTGVMLRGRWAVPRGLERWDFYALKGVIEALVQSITLAPGRCEPDVHFCLQPGRAARLTIGDDTIGHLGEIAGKVREAYDLPDPVYAAELDLELLRRHAATPRYQSFSRFPAVTRDVAFLIPREVPAQRAESLIRQSAGPHLESLLLFDAYEGPPLPADQRNLAFSLAFRAADRTLTDQEVEQSMEAVRARLRQDLGATIRE